MNRGSDMVISLIHCKRRRGRESRSQHNPLLPRLGCGHFRSIHNKSNLTAKVKTLRYGGFGNRGHPSRNTTEKFRFFSACCVHGNPSRPPGGEKSSFKFCSKSYVMFGCREAELSSLFMRGKGSAFCTQNTTYRS